MNASKKIKRLLPKDFKEEQTTIWSFKQNVIIKHSKPGDLVIDYFCGAEPHMNQNFSSEMQETFRFCKITPLICSHPPYANIIRYTDSKEDDLSLM
ncbi:MAG: hypothetical protein NZ853_10155 [Leptospiraceae bacterium]|nr:hypothetical protein [Leptospiraceae bacterium]MDW7974981.1 hypothetical protein [Leptospiraceae bacterium]